MEQKPPALMHCSIATALEEVGERWSLLIVRECVLGSRRFDEFQRRLGVARNILATRLARLVELGVLQRAPLEDDARQAYELTPKGEELMPVLIALLQWGDRWAPPPNGSPVRYLDAASGKPIGRLGARVPGGRPLRARDVRIEPGPSATPALVERLARRNSAVQGRR